MNLLPLQKLLLQEGEPVRWRRVSFEFFLIQPLNKQPIANSKNQPKDMIFEKSKDSLDFFTKQLTCRHSNELKKFQIFSFNNYIEK